MQLLFNDSGKAKLSIAYLNNWYYELVHKFDMQVYHFCLKLVEIVNFL